MSGDVGRDPAFDSGLTQIDVLFLERQSLGADPEPRIEAKHDNRLLWFSQRCHPFVVCSNRFAFGLPKESNDRRPAELWDDRPTNRTVDRRNRVKVLCFLVRVIDDLSAAVLADVC